MERDARRLPVVEEQINFNSHAHVERDENVVDMGKQILDFNSHAHVERDISADVKIVNIFISTHTLTWSVTRQLGIWFSYAEFQLTRSRGA